MNSSRSGRKKSQSEFALELEKRQALKKEYGVRRVEPREELEQRLDNVVFRIGFASSRAMARQMVSHRHLSLNKKRVSIPSIKVRLGDKIFLNRQAKLPEGFNKHKAPNWLKVDKKKLSAEILTMPTGALMP